jgi:hypothetical protein
MVSPLLSVCIRVAPVVSDGAAVAIGVGAVLAGGVVANGVGAIVGVTGLGVTGGGALIGAGATVATVGAGRVVGDAIGVGVTGAGEGCTDAVGVSERIPGVFERVGSSVMVGAGFGAGLFAGSTAGEAGLGEACWAWPPVFAATCFVSAGWLPRSRVAKKYAPTVTTPRMTTVPILYSSRMTDPSRDVVKSRQAGCSGIERTGRLTAPSPHPCAPRTARRRHPRYDRPPNADNIRRRRFGVKGKCRRR